MSQITRLRNFVLFRNKLLIRKIRYYANTLGKGSFVIKNINGSLMKLNTGEKGIHYELIVDGIREKQSTEEIKKSIKKDDVVIDIGANIGYYSLLMHNAKKIYALEPSFKSFSLLKKNILLNNYKNIIPYNIAIGDKNGYAYINVSEKCNWNTIRDVDKKRFHIIGKEKIRMMTFDEFVEANRISPTFVRMDVEGYEYNIIKGMKKFLKSSRKCRIFIELHPHTMEEEETLFVLNTLKNNGFEISKAIRSYTMPELPYKKDVYYNLGIGDMINDKEIISGKKGAFEIFFEKCLQ